MFVFNKNISLNVMYCLGEKCCLRSTHWPFQLKCFFVGVLNNLHQITRIFDHSSMHISYNSKTFDHVLPLMPISNLLTTFRFCHSTAAPDFFLSHSSVDLFVCFGLLSCRKALAQLQISGKWPYVISSYSVILGRIPRQIKRSP